MFGFFTRDTADQREIKRLENLVRLLTDERDRAVEHSKKTFAANIKLIQKKKQLEQALGEECDRANAAQSRLYSFTAPRRRDPRGRFLPLRDMGTAA